MSARDELARLVSNSGTTSKSSLSRADAILAAGYSKPRTITTAEELDALAPCSVVLSDMGVVWEKDVDTEEPEFPWWCTPGDSHRYPARRISLPATVLYEP